MGRLPCPDMRNTGPATEGAQDSPCGSTHVNQYGYLPWKTLGIEPLKDSSGECLWYVVSGDYKSGTTAARMLNEDSNGLLRVRDENLDLYHGNAPGDRPIAIIIAPGPAIQGQTRGAIGKHCRNDYTETNFLEPDNSLVYSTNHDLDGSGDDADKIWAYSYGSASSRLENVNFNDKMVWITRDEYWDAVKAQNDLNISLPGSAIEQLTSDLTKCFADYANDANNENSWLPWPAAISNGLSDYRDDASGGGASLYVDQNNPSSLIGRLPQSIVNSDTAESGLPAASPVSTHADKSNIFKTDFVGDDCLTPERKDLWRNWKDHFFYAVSRDFEMQDGSIVAPLSNRCAAAGDCLQVETLAGVPFPNKIAAIVFYAGSAGAGQSRNSPPVDPDEKNDLSNYLDSQDASHSNAHQYPSDAAYAATGGDVNVYFNDAGDLLYCIWVDALGTGLDFGRCS